MTLEWYFIIVSFVAFVGSAEKRAYLMQRFPQLSEDSFANSRDTTFEQHVLLNTQGKGQKPATSLHSLFMNQTK